jgi:glycosyltransferase involved in cell wall biosynthesis
MTQPLETVGLTPAASPAAERPTRVLMITSCWPKPGEPRTTYFIKRQAEFLQASGVDVDVFPFNGRQRLRHYVTAWAQARARLARGGYDLVHAQFGQSGALAFPKRLPLVVTLRGDDLQGIIADETGSIGFKGRVLQRLSQWIAARADAVIVVSDHMRAFLTDAVPVYTIPSGLDFEIFRVIPKDEARRHLKLPLDKRLVLFAGKPANPRKRYGLAKRAVELVDQSLGAELVVAWGVLHPDMAYYMNACDALIFTSVQEGSPNVVKEALACNLPVVSVPVGDVPVRLRGVAGCELCPDDRPESLAAALERVLRRRERCQGRAAVQDLDESLITARVLDVYRTVLARDR